MNAILVSVWNGITGFYTAVWQTRLGKILLCACCVLLAAAVVVGINIYREGSATQNKADTLLAEYKESALESVQPTGAQASAGASSGAETAGTAYETLEGYLVLGTLKIDKIDQELPIITYSDESSLKVSACYYLGALPGEKGNMVITGHDYTDGSIFGKLYELENGDSVVFSTMEKAYTYEVYETETINPDDVSALDEYEGDYALSLITCTDSGNKRLIVRCKLVDTVDAA